jgi:formylglycine-generating enzyme
MKSNTQPYSDEPPGASPDSSRVGNFYKYDDVANGYDDGYAVTGSPMLSISQNYLTDVGAYSASPSYYGTFDQGGNLWEWNETAATTLKRGLRGSGWNSDFVHAHAANRSSGNPSFEDRDLGFRVARVVPEPASLGLCVAALLVVALTRDKSLRRLI